MKTIVFQEKFKFDLMKVRRYGASRVIIIALFVTALLLIGCSEPSETGDLHGTWSDGWGTMIIDSSAKTIEYDSGFNFYYKGTIENDPNFTARTGILIIKFSEYKDWSGNNISENINKFGGLYWNELTLLSVLMADANTDGGLTHVIIDKLEEAQTTFTIDNASKYVDWSILGAYTK